MWAILFGRALVEPIDDLPIEDLRIKESADFAAETVPEELKILADDFVAHGYHLRRLISIIALSDAFAAESRAADESLSAAEEPAMPWHAFPLTQLRPEQVVGSLLQASSLATLDYQSHIVIRFARAVGQAEFVKQYGDSGEEEFSPQGGTIPQRLLLLNGELVKKKTEENLIANAATQIAALASTNEKAVEIAYLACLSRRPTPDESRHFVARLADKRSGAGAGKRWKTSIGPW